MHLWQPLLTNPSPLIFTDLDGTLLDHDNYSHQAAEPAITLLNQYRVPIIPVTSKTCAELLQLRKQLDNSHPFIVENGAAIYIPIGYFSKEIIEEVFNRTNMGELSVSTTDPNFYVYTLGYGRTYWIDRIKARSKTLAGAFTSFSALGSEGIAEHTDLPLDRAKLANLREASEPLLWHGDDTQLAQLKAGIFEDGGQVLRGGRFVHILDQQAGKGQALKRLLSCYQQQMPATEFTTAALGDAENDLSMLEVVDLPVVIRSRHRDLPDAHHIPNINISQKIGPAGWNETMSSFIGKIINH